jgi:hypothetical protein
VTLLPTTIVTDADLPEGMMHGFDCQGHLIVALRYMPHYERLIGDADAEKSVTSWHISASGARRIASIAAWNSYGDDHPTAGSA